MKSTTVSLLVFIFFLFLLQLNLSAKTVRGVVIDVKSNEPLKDVVVMVIDTANVIRAMQNTDSAGVFIITGLKEAIFKVRTYRYGYVSTTTGPYNLSRHDTLGMLIRLEATPFELKEVVVTATRVIPYLDRVHFYERKEMRSGHFVTWNDFKNRGLSSVYDIFRGIPGLIVKNNTVYFLRYAANAMGGTAPQPLIYVDGALLPNEPDNIWWLNPENVLAIETYNVNWAPEEYSRGTRGGVILIWTKN